MKKFIAAMVFSSLFASASSHAFVGILLRRAASVTFPPLAVAGEVYWVGQEMADGIDQAVDSFFKRDKSRGEFLARVKMVLVQYPETGAQERRLGYRKDPSNPYNRDRITVYKRDYDNALGFSRVHRDANDTTEAMDLEEVQDKRMLYILDKTVSPYVFRPAWQDPFTQLHYPVGESEEERARREHEEFKRNTAGLGGVPG